MKFAMINKSLMVAGITIVSLISFPVLAEEPPETPSVESPAVEDPTKKCFAYLESMPELKPLEAKIPKKLSEATFEQLAKQDRATDQEKLLIAKLAKGTKICWDLDFDWQTRIRPTGGTIHAAGRKILEVHRDNVMSSFIDLYNQKISYGEYIKQRQAATGNYNRDMDAANAKSHEAIAENAAAEEKISALEQAQKRQMWSNIWDGMAKGIRNSQPPRAVTCTPNGFGGVRCQ